MLNSLRSFFSGGSFIAAPAWASAKGKKASSLDTVATGATGSFSAGRPSEQKATMIQNFFRNCSGAYSAVQDFFCGAPSTEPSGVMRVAVDNQLEEKKGELKERFPQDREVIEGLGQQHFQYRAVNTYSLASYAKLCEIGVKMKAGGSVQDLASPKDYEKCRQYSVENDLIIYKTSALGVPKDEAKALFQSLFEQKGEILWQNPVGKQETEDRIKSRTEQIKTEWLKSDSPSASLFNYKEEIIEKAVTQFSKDSYPVSEKAARKILKEFFHENEEGVLSEARNEALSQQYLGECKKYSSLQKAIVDCITGCTELDEKKSKEVLGRFIESQQEVPTCENLERYLNEWKEYEEGRASMARELAPTKEDGILAANTRVNAGNRGSQPVEGHLMPDEALDAFDSEFAHLRPRLPTKATLNAFRFKKRIACSFDVRSQ